jgi:hypothetical protein
MVDQDATCPFMGFWPRVGSRPARGGESQDRPVLDRLVCRSAAVAIIRRAVRPQRYVDQWRSPMPHQNRSATSGSM